MHTDTNKQINTRDSLNAGLQIPRDAAGFGA